MTTKLSHVNVAPAQTWNYLHVNDVAFEVGQAAAPEQALAATTNLGAEADAWVVGHAGSIERAEMHDGDELEIHVDERSQARELSVADGAHATIRILATGSAEAGHVLAISVGKGAHLEIVGIYDRFDAPYLEGIAVSLARDATLDVRQFSLAGKKSALGIDIAQAGAGSSVEVRSRYLAGAGELVDMTYTCRMSGADTTCDMAFSGVLGQGGAKCLRDTIDLMHGAKGASGLENETVLLAGSDVVNKSLPTILCDEDDVAGDHGATIGSISPEQLAYLADRGLTSDDVVALYTQAVLEDALAHAKGQARTATLAAAKRILGDEAAALLDEGDAR